MNTRIVFVSVLIVLLVGACANKGSAQSDYSTKKCVGASHGGLELADGHTYDLAGGADAALVSTDMAAASPSMTLDLRHVAEADRLGAEGLVVGDVFDANGATYKVNRICPLVVEVQEQ